MNIKLLLGVALLSMILLVSSCNEDQSFQPDFSRYTLFSVSLTDNPTDLQEVNIDLKSVVILGEGERQTLELDTEAGIYNLLDYQDGLDTVIAAEVIELDFIKEIRLILGDNNFVVTSGGEEFPMKVPSGSQSGLKIKTCVDLTETMEYELLIDFDADKSVVRQGNGRYLLKPVIRVLNEDGRCDDDGDDNDYEEDEEEENEEELSFEDLPEDAQLFLEENYEGYEFSIASDILCGMEDAVFRVKAEQEVDGETNKQYIFFDAEGGLIQILTPIAPEVLPTAVEDALNSGYPAFELEVETIFEVDRGQSEEDPAIYQVLLEHRGNDRLLEVTIDEEGTVLCELEIEE